MQHIFKSIKYFIFFIFIAGASPFILAKLGFWETSYASTPKFKEAYPKTELTGSVRSYASAVERAGTAVVSISSKKEMTPQEMNPMMRDPFFRQFFGDPRGGYGAPAPEMVPSI